MAVIPTVSMKVTGRIYTKVKEIQAQTLSTQAEALEMFVNDLIATTATLEMKNKKKEKEIKKLKNEIKELEKANEELRKAV